MNYLLTNQETERLKFRLLTADDLEAWVPLFEENDVALFLEMDPELSPRELCQKWFDKSFHRQENNLGGMNVLIDKARQTIIKIQ